jgi:prophage DNA circulation protein
MEAASRSRSDKGFNALTQLRTAFVDHLTAGMGTLAPVRQVQLTTPMPSLALAYRDYGDARRGESLARRNRDVLRSGHPGMIPAGVPLDLVGG